MVVLVLRGGGRADGAPRSEVVVVVMVVVVRVLVEL